MITSGLIEAGRAERDQRIDSYGRRVAAGTLDADAAEAEIRCWSDIAEWLAGKPRPHATSWPDLEAATAKAVTHITGRIEKLDGQTNVPPETLGALRDRRSWLTIIHDRVRTERAMICNRKDAA